MNFSGIQSISADIKITAGSLFAKFTANRVAKFYLFISFKYDKAFFLE